MKKKEIENEYRKMMSNIFQNYGDSKPENRINCYLCRNCGHIIKTIDVDYGTTPMFIKCEKCSFDLASSTFYENMPQEIEPTYVWYRPSLKETLKLTCRMVDHVLKGGLVLKPIKDE